MYLKAKAIPHEAKEVTAANNFSSINSAFPSSLNILRISSSFSFVVLCDATKLILSFIAMAVFGMTLYIAESGIIHSES